MCFKWGGWIRLKRVRNRLLQREHNLSPASWSISSRRISAGVDQEIKQLHPVDTNFDQLCHPLSSNFDGAECKRVGLKAWNLLTLRSIRGQYPKSRLRLLDLPSAPQHMEVGTQWVNSGPWLDIGITLVPWYICLRPGKASSPDPTHQRSHRRACACPFNLQASKMQTPPFRSRPKFHLTSTQSTGSPGSHYPSTPTSGAIITPLTATAYSPFRSAGLKPPTPFGAPMQLASRSPQKFRKCRSNAGLRARRALTSKIFWLALLFGALIMWWRSGGADKLDIVRLSASELGRELFPEVRTRDLQFFPATDLKIHVSLSPPIFVCITWLMTNSMLVAGPRPPIDFAKMALFQVRSLQPNNWSHW